jgi:protein-S-isoprenylcysteine O-methyltransferase Ste14
VPLAGVLLLVAVACVWRPWLQRRRYGASGVLLFRSGNAAQKLRDGLGLLVFALLLGQAIVAAAWPEALPLSQADRRSAAGVRHVAGAVLLFGGLVLLVAAQLNLGESWRVGIDEAAQPGLITHGLYRFCRNPVFLAMLVIIAGYTLLLPTLVSFGILVGASLAIRQQALAEEAYLERAYGVECRRYARRVGRFLPGVGKSR